MQLFRPVGLEELRLVYDTGMRAFPPRLADQPIFYPVLNEDYAVQIARDWNTKTGTRAGFVTRFEVDDEYAGRLERRVVGGREHEELWVPAEERHESVLRRRLPRIHPRQLRASREGRASAVVALTKTLSYSGMDFILEIAANPVPQLLLLGRSGLRGR